MKTFLVWLLLALALPAIAQTPAVPATLIAPVPAANDDASAAIDKLREGLVTSFKKGDVDTLLTYLDPQVVVTWQNSEVCRGPESVKAFYQKMLGGDKPIVRSIHSEPKVLGRQVFGDWAVSWGNLHDHFVLTDGSDLPLESVFTATIAKRGDRWLVTAFHASVNAFENPILQIATKKIAFWAGLSGGVAGLVIGWFLARILGRSRAAR
jgi:ketosteroid isomerase-like protein